MRGFTKRLAMLGCGSLALLGGNLVPVPEARAQFFWAPWANDRPRPAPKPHVPAKPVPAPGDDLPPIVPKESEAPPPPDDRPYDGKLLRLAEILGAIHYLRELCGAQEGQLWRDQMQDILKDEGTTAVRRAKLVNSFNDGYRGYRRTYRTCTPSASVAINHFSSEGSEIALALAKSSQTASNTHEGQKQLQGADKPGADKPGADKPGDKQGSDKSPQAQGGKPATLDTANAAASPDARAAGTTVAPDSALPQARHGSHRQTAPAAEPPD